MTNMFDFEAFKQAAIKGLYEGKPLTGENGLFTPLLKWYATAALFRVRFGERNGWPSLPNPAHRAEPSKRYNY